MSAETSSSYEKKVVTIIAEQLHLDATTVTPTSTLESLGADSLDRVELVMKLEEEFGIEIHDEDADKLVSVADLLAYIQERQK